MGCRNQRKVAGFGTFSSWVVWQDHSVLPSESETDELKWCIRVSMKTTGRKYKTVKTLEAKGTPECIVSTIVYETRSLPDPGAQGFTSLAGQQSFLSPPTPVLGLRAHTDTPAFFVVLVVKCRCWGSELVPSCSGNKQFTYWAISLVLGYEGGSRE